MRCEIGADELYPFWEIEPCDDGTFEIPAELAARYQRVMADFRAMQSEIEKIHEEYADNRRKGR